MEKTLVYHLYVKDDFEENIAIGSDFDGAIMSETLCKIEQIPKLFEYLVDKGLDKRLLYKIFYKIDEYPTIMS